ncbi:MAG: subtilisin family serine protease [Flammeovirgaceae bacterium]|jgi:subtilisin family serine protease
MNSFFKENGISTDKVTHRYTSAISGFAAKLTTAEVDALKSNSNIFSVEKDYIVEMQGFIVESVEKAAKNGGASNARQTSECFVSRAGGSGNGAGKNTWVWVVDSGIDLDHPDLNVVTNSNYAKSFVGGSANDANGHGTHVAGIIGGINNTIGGVGISAGAAVVPVRVFGASGGSSSATIIAGINHVAANDISGDIANLSLGGFYGSGCANGSAYRNSISNLARTSKVAIAAGNDAQFAGNYQPACLGGSNVYTVASMTCNRSFSSFSNYGRAPIDWIATGSSVKSTYLNGGYATLSGTSMATPVVAGIMHQRNSAPRNCGSVTRSGVSYPIACK